MFDRHSIYSGGRIQEEFEHNTKERKLKLRSDQELRKHIPYLAFTGELWGVFSEFVGENIPRDIQKALYIHTVFYVCLILYSLLPFHSKNEEPMTQIL